MVEKIIAIGVVLLAIFNSKKYVEYVIPLLMATIVYFIFDGDRTSGSLNHIFGFPHLRRIIFLLIMLEISPECGPFFLKGAKCVPERRKNQLIHLLLIFSLTLFFIILYVNLLVIMESTDSDAGDIMIAIILFILTPFTGACIVRYGFRMRARMFEHPYEETQERLAAEKAETERQQQADLAERKRLIEKQKAESFLQFWNLATYQYGLESKLRDIALETRNGSFVLPSGDTPPIRWVRNEDRIAVIDQIIQSTGIHDDSIPNEYSKQRSPYLELVTGEDFRINQYLGLKYSDDLTARWQTQIPNLPQRYFKNWVNYASVRYSCIKGILKDVFVYYKDEYYLIKAGIDGETAVQEVLDMHKGAFYVLHNLRLEFPNKDGTMDSVETDTLVLSPTGVFAIEAKNYGKSGRYRIVVTSDGNWYKEYPSRYEDEDPKRELMKNPFKQNDRHVAYLEAFINKTLNHDMMNWIHVENIVVIANDNVEIKSDLKSGQTLTRIGNLYGHLTKNQTQILNMDELNIVKTALEENSLPGKKYPLNDYTGDIKILVDTIAWLNAGQDQMLDVAAKVLTDHPELVVSD